MLLRSPLLRISGVVLSTSGAKVRSHRPTAIVTSRISVMVTTVL
jgi:hypothetical protein